MAVALAATPAAKAVAGGRYCQKQPLLPPGRFSNMSALLGVYRATARGGCSGSSGAARVLFPDTEAVAAGVGGKRPPPPVLLQPKRRHPLHTQPTHAALFGWEEEEGGRTAPAGGAVAEAVVRTNWRRQQQQPCVDMQQREADERALHARLERWRQAVAEALHRRPTSIVSDAALHALADAAPINFTSLQVGHPKPKP